jgi:SAM-dependent methyltransferase
MRARALASTPEDLRVEYVEGRAEHLPLSENSCALITAATSASWFDRTAFYQEVQRVLRPRGLLAIVQNRRCFWESAPLEALETLLEDTVPGYRRRTHYDPAGGFSQTDYASELASNGAFSRVITRNWRWSQRMTSAQFASLGMTLTVAQEGARRIGKAQLEKKLGALTSKFADRLAVLEVPFVTELTMATATGCVRVRNGGRALR